MKLNKNHILLLTASIAVLIAGLYFLVKFFFFPLSVSATRDEIKNAGFNQIMGIKPASATTKPSKKKEQIKTIIKKVYVPDLTKPLNCKNLNVFLCTVKYLRYLKYLPISLSYDGKYKFSFPMPENLKKIAYSYGWNEQNPLIIGAIAKYLYESGRIKDGDYDEPEINNKLLYELEQSAEKNQFNKQPWDWVLVKQSKNNEKAELYENGRIIFSFPVNTGILGLTPNGTWYVFLRLPDTTMTGLFPTPITKKLYASLKKSKHFKNIECLDGHPVMLVHYSDSGIKYIDYFHKSVALHYMYRKYYGFPQSAGCVELSEQDALLLYKQIGYGTIVTVTGSTISKKNSNVAKVNAVNKTNRTARTKQPVEKINNKKNKK
ncbi:MAG: L,D-transpeptidase [Candidatus Acidulodesulfobacterium sp.]